MAGRKNPLQERNTFLPKADNSRTIEERERLLKQHWVEQHIFCHFCGQEIFLESANEDNLNALELTKQERQLGAHMNCYRKRTSQIQL